MLSLNNCPQFKAGRAAPVVIKTVWDSCLSNILPAVGPKITLIYINALLISAFNMKNPIDIMALFQGDNFAMCESQENQLFS